MKELNNQTWHWSTERDGALYSSWLFRRYKHCTRPPTNTATTALCDSLSTTSHFTDIVTTSETLGFLRPCHNNTLHLKNMEIRQNPLSCSSNIYTYTYSWHITPWLLKSYVRFVWKTLRNFLFTSCSDRLRGPPSSSSNGCRKGRGDFSEGIKLAKAWSWVNFMN
jgi:hypothetical protein